MGERIAEEMSRLTSEMGVEPEVIYTAQQTHSANVAYCNGNNGETFVSGRIFENTDGLLTDQKGVGLLIKYADCTPVIIFDPANGVLANVHSGWRGTTQRIAVRAVEKMCRTFGSKVEDLIVYVGPSIDQDNYQVGPEVYAAFANFSKRDDFFEPDGDKYRLSMLDANVSSLLEAGIRKEHMEVERASTYTDSRLHSARKEGAVYQLNGLFAMMEKGLS
ncbi:hypothetical protein ADIAL_1377 [Alkalibacterium sp. AK22]|nr:hypothetical protein ADIAL_1377 [Alkalibacterium sp. AK22]